MLNSPYGDTKGQTQATLKINIVFSFDENILLLKAEKLQ